jgi:hypothetical protein
MATVLRSRQVVPYGTILLFALTCGLYVTMLANISFSVGGGEASFSQAIAALFAVVGLWIALAVLLFVGAIMGEMPRWSVVVAFILVPLSGVATTVAIDMCSRRIAWAVIVPTLLPLPIALYAAWARWPRVHASLPDKESSIIAWGLVFTLSIGTLILALYY